MIDDASTAHILGLYREAADLLEECQITSTTEERAAYSFAIFQTESAASFARNALRPT